ncbi:MAG: RNA-binding S4 domain-containing protein [Betaproteobacteria bacterium]|nr:RNA-binding S4 domain-containing protein [Betaproteobacteria bacterium]MDE2003299.1 RNA-binding S4 domain-containing protein [Betaproteobacteria bacterium]MDE2209505.1 RNA-binding S4 domain-containing protein [Betaproteobacteria bacterium]
MRRAGAAASEAARVRFDKWLWAARFYRTRSLAAQAIEAGQARIDGERVKPAHAVQAGTQVSVRRQDLGWQVEVLEARDRRGSATIAASMYRESPESVAERERKLAARKAMGSNAADVPGRPTKRDRRKLEDFLAEP